MSKLLLGLLVFGCVSVASALGIPAPRDVKRDPVPKPTPAPAPTPVASSPSSFKALWEGKHPDAGHWTLYAQDAISKYAPDLVRGADDVETFCPKYDRLGTQDRINFWVQLVAAMTKYESGFNPASRMVETSMGRDPLTGRQTASEGLMQLSYSDARNYARVVPNGVCDFDFAADQAFGVKDLRRSILDPRSNLTCAIGILNRQVERDHKIAVSKTAYWAVIKTDRKTNKLSEIRAITRALSFCQ